MDKIPWTLIIAKLSNTLTEADNRLLEEWLQNDLHKEMDYVILVWVDNNTQIQRVRSRDSLMREDAINRINSQMPLDRKKDFANIVIENNDTLAKTKEQVDLLIEFLRSI